LQAARRLYNGNASSFNQAIAVFPGSIVAGAQRLEKKDFFAAEEHKKSDIEMKF
jgi:LemA protein